MSKKFNGLSVAGGEKDTGEKHPYTRSVPDQHIPLLIHCVEYLKDDNVIRIPKKLLDKLKSRFGEDLVVTVRLKQI